MRTIVLLLAIAAVALSPVEANKKKTCSTKTVTSTDYASQTVTTWAPPVSVTHTQSHHKSVCHETDTITSTATVSVTKWGKWGKNDKRGGADKTKTVTHTTTCAPVTKTEEATTTHTTCSSKHDKRFFTYNEDIVRPTALVQQADAQQITNAERLRRGLPISKAVIKRGLHELQQEENDAQVQDKFEGEFEYEYDAESENWLKKRDGEIVERHGDKSGGWGAWAQGWAKGKHNGGGDYNVYPSCTPTTTTITTTKTETDTETPTTTVATTTVCRKTRTTFVSTTVTETDTITKKKHHHHTTTTTTPHWHTYTVTWTHTPTKTSHHWHTVTKHTGSCEPTAKP